jgi:hydrogenase maturation protease
VRSDDGVGIHVVARLADADLPPHVDTEAAGTCGLGVLDLIVGYDRLIIVDAIDLDEPPGTVLELDLDDLSRTATLHAASPHDTDLLTALDTGRRLGLVLPRRIRIVAVQIQDTTTLSEECTPAVQGAIENACGIVLRLVDS